jgi:hypothetical protein
MSTGTASFRKGIGGHQRGWEGISNIWLTPPAILRALGPFGLDPCAAPEPRPWPTAAAHYAAPEQDGLELPWRGRVWLNPPYGPHTGLWLERLADHGDGIAIIFARTETEMFFEHVWSRASGLLFLKGRLHFHRANGERAKANSGAPSVLVAYGESNLRALEESGIPGKIVRLR